MLNELIAPLKYQSAITALKALLMAESYNQCKLALAAGMTEDYIESNIMFNVGEGEFFPTGQEDVLHQVNLYVLKEDTIEDDVESQTQDWNLCLDLYAAQASWADESGDLNKSSTNSNKRLDYLHDQMFAILEAQKNHWINSFGVIDNLKRVPSNGWLKYMRNVDNDAITTPFAFGRLQYNLTIDQDKLLNEEGKTITEYLFTLTANNDLTQKILINQGDTNDTE